MAECGDSMICVKCGKPERTDKSQYSEYLCNCVETVKDHFQTLPRTGNSSNPEMMQGCNHYLRDHQTSGPNEVMGMPRRGDGKVYCNSCYTLDNFREVFLLAYRKNNFDELEVQNIHGKAEAVKEEIPALACNCCGNVQIKI